jgi:hypothetical protein
MKKITVPLGFQCYTITQEANKFLKNYVEILFLTVHFHVLLESFVLKNCHNSVMVRDNLTIPIAMSS